jgi:hypothetical protein
MNPMRFHESCPDCGLIVDDGFAYSDERRVRCVDKSYNFTCPRCKAHYSKDDFIEALYEKSMAQHHNHAKADLSQEEQD